MWRLISFVIHQENFVRKSPIIIREKTKEEIIEEKSEEARSIELLLIRGKNAISNGDLKEAKTVLEIKVQARTKELQELAERQEELVKQRTEELQQKLMEMERFEKLAVGRELKMIELKKEIKELEKGRKV